MYEIFASLGFPHDGPVGTHHCKVGHLCPNCLQLQAQKYTKRGLSLGFCLYAIIALVLVMQQVT